MLFRSEFVRQWLIQNGFQGKTGQQIPDMSEAWIQEISSRYIELFEAVSGLRFIPENLTAEILELKITERLKNLSLN